MPNPNRSLTPVFTLAKKDFIMEWRQRHTLFGVLLYVGSSVFVVYMMNGQPAGKVWNALFWITQLFVATNAVAKSFLQESAERFRYYFTIVHPVSFLLAKMIYSILLMLVMNAVTFALFSLLLGTPLEQAGLFFVISALGGLSLSVVFTFLSAIAAKAGQNAALMAVLGFPLVTPMLLMLSNLALKAVTPVYQPDWWKVATTLGMLDGLVVLLGVILFPFLWQE